MIFEVGEDLSFGTSGEVLANAGPIDEFDAVNAVVGHDFGQLRVLCRRPPEFPLIGIVSRLVSSEALKHGPARPYTGGKIIF